MHMHMDGRHWWLKKTIGVIAVLIVIGTVVGWAVTVLWNWLLPGLFGLTTITFWQGLGLFVLGKLLFGGFRGFGHHRHRRDRHWHKRWQRMTPEQREQFSRGMRRGCRWSGRGGEMPQSGSETL